MNGPTRPFMILPKTFTIFPWMMSYSCNPQLKEMFWWLKKSPSITNSWALQTGVDQSGLALSHLSVSKWSKSNGFSQWGFQILMPEAATKIGNKLMHKKIDVYCSLQIKYILVIQNFQFHLNIPWIHTWPHTSPVSIANHSFYSCISNAPMANHLRWCQSTVARWGQG